MAQTANTLSFLEVPGVLYTICSCLDKTKPTNINQLLPLSNRIFQCMREISSWDSVRKEMNDNSQGVYQRFLKALQNKILQTLEHFPNEDACTVVFRISTRDLKGTKRVLASCVEQEEGVFIKSVKRVDKGPTIDLTAVCKVSRCSLVNSQFDGIRKAIKSVKGFLYDYEIIDEVCSFESLKISAMETKTILSPLSLNCRSTRSSAEGDIVKCDPELLSDISSTSARFHRIEDELCNTQSKIKEDIHKIYELIYSMKENINTRSRVKLIRKKTVLKIGTIDLDTETCCEWKREDIKTVMMAKKSEGGMGLSDIEVPADIPYIFEDVVACLIEDQEITERACKNLNGITTSKAIQQYIVRWVISNIMESSEQ